MNKKQKLMATAAIVAVGCLAGISGFKTTEKSSMSALTISNIEALTYDEWGYDHGCVSNGDGCIIRYNRWYPDLLPKDL